MKNSTSTFSPIYVFLLMFLGPNHVNHQALCKLLKGNSSMFEGKRKKRFLEEEESWRKAGGEGCRARRSLGVLVIKGV